MNQSELGYLITTATNTTNQDQVDRDATLAKLEIGILSLIFILIVLGNGSVIIALVGAKVKIQRMYYFLLHLTISDLLTAFFNVLPQLIWEITVEFHGNNFLCKFVKYIQLLGPYLSSYVLVVTAIDRYQTICFPLANCTWTERRAKIMISVAWLIALICCFPQAFIFSYVQIEMTSFPNKVSFFRVHDEPVQQQQPKLHTKYMFQCWGSFIQPYGEKIYVLWYAVSVFFIPLVILVFTYFCICKMIWINARDRINLKSNSTSDKYRKQPLIFHSKLPFNLSKQKSEREVDKNFISNTTSGKVESNQLSDSNNLRVCSNSKAVNQPKNCEQPKQSKCASINLNFVLMRRNNQKQQLNRIEQKQIVSLPPVSVQSYQKSVTPIQLADHSFQAQNSLVENQIDNSAGDLRTPTSSTVDLSALATSSLNKFTSNQMKSASIFASRTPAHANKLSRAKIKTIRVTLVVIICYISCSLPFCAVQLWAHFYPNAQSSKLWTAPLITIAMLLPSLNSVLNPFIYLLLNRNLLYTLFKMIGANCVDATNDYRTGATNQRSSVRMQKITLAGAGDVVQRGASNNSLALSPVLTNYNASNAEEVLRKNRLKRMSNNQPVKCETRTNQSSKDRMTMQVEEKSDGGQIGNRISDRISNTINIGGSQIDKNSTTNKNNKIIINPNSNRTNHTTQNDENVHKVICSAKPNNEHKKVETVANLNLGLTKINVECLNGNSEQMNNAMRMTNFNLPRTQTETNSLILVTKEQPQFLHQSSSSAPDLKTN